jgi:diguanylate cyclase (GGDEF)-like protein
MLADKIRKNVEELRLDINDNKVNFTISLGVSKVYNSSETNIEKALKRADDALYDAKNSGRNKVCIKL